MSRNAIHAPRRGFTLTELLVVIGIIAIMAVLTLVSVKAITRDARVASGANALSAALDNARALALKTNDIVIVVFRPRLDGEREQFLELVTARWTGESYRDPSLLSPPVIDRFVPAPEVPVRRLPPGIKLAAPSYVIDQDTTWFTQTHLPLAATEILGVMLGVMYGPDGTTLSQNPHSDSSYLWVDFKPEFDEEFGTPLVRRGPDPNDNFLPWQVGEFVEQENPADETFVTIAPFVAVYDDTEARERRSGTWDTTPEGRQRYFDDLVGSPLGFITTNADRIHFNRYTGVVMR